jgi:hypothetical protein
MVQLTGCSTDSGSIDSGSELNFTSGKGTETNPFHVTNIYQLQSIDDPDYLDMHFIQMEDIDASPSADFQNGSGFKHIGDLDSPFTGSYDGNGFVIRDLHLHIQKVQGTHTGLFGYILNGRIENITIDNSARLENKQSVQITAYLESELQTEQQTEYIMSSNVDLSDARGVGGMVGFNDGGDVLNCLFIGTMGGSSPTAGLVGINTGLVENSHFEGLIGTLRPNAGLVGINTGKIIRSSAKVSIGSPSAASGLVDTNYGEISQSFAHVDLNANLLVAGLAARNLGGRIENSYVTGEAFSHFRAAGLVLTNEGEIINSYSQMNVKIEFQVNSEGFSASGFVLENNEDGMIENSYASGSLTSSGGVAELSTVILKNRGTVKSLYWDMDSLSNEPDVLDGSNDGITGLTTDQMSGSTAQDYMPMFDWNNVWQTTTGYPVLRWEE